jgi:hypothetical protein
MEFESSEAAEEFEWERRRHALAQLLLARGHQQAAAVTAVSHYSTAYAGDGTWKVILAVPAPLYDLACGEFAGDIAAACRDIVGAEDFSDVIYRVQSPPYEASWIEAIIRSVSAPNRVASERPAELAVETK